ncbi:MAG: TetR/AcrR family transcriptional regulator [Candidatus Krumholzibacteriia bacterium]|nr:TetR/AcrR family transcriptional regulator [Candidatus Latescibacterota bacterium]
MTASKSKADKRERILAAAVESFSRQGFYRTRIHDIAARAGVADGTVYLYYRNKEALLEAVFAEVMESFLETAQAKARQPLPAPERLRQVLALHLGALGRDRDLATVFQVELRHSVRLMERYGQGHLRDYFRLIAGLLESGQAEGTVRPGLDARFAARCIFGMVDESVTAWVLHGQDRQLDELAAPLMDFLLHGLAPAGSGV